MIAETVSPLFDRVEDCKQGEHALLFGQQTDADSRRYPERALEADEQAGEIVAGRSRPQPPTLTI